jgi:hypothetical protein
VKPQAGGQIEIQIRMMHHMQTPEGRNGVMQDVLRVNDQVQQDHAADDFQPIGNGRMTGQVTIS